MIEDYGKAADAAQNCDAKYTEEGLLATLSTLNVLEYGGEKGLSEMIRNVRGILRLFEVDVPSEPLHHVPIFDMRSYVARSTLGISE